MTKISNQYSLTNILTADLANSRLGINNVSPTVALDVTGAGKFSGASLIVGSAVAATNVKLFLNGVASKAASIEFQQSGVTQWYLGNGAASEDNNFELYNSNGTMAMKIIKSTNAIAFTGAATFSSSVSVGDYLRLTKASSTDIQAYTGSAYSNLNYDAASHNWQCSGGTAKMVLTSSGNVGIGTTTPDQLLSVRKTSVGAETIALALQNIGGTAGTSVSMVFCPHESSATPEPLAKISGIRITGPNALTDLGFYTYGIGGLIERMRITSGGQVCIGTTTNYNYKLVLRTDSTGDTAGSMYIINSANTASIYMFCATNTFMNTSDATMWMKRNGTTSRSINASGTINASGADYAEYMVKETTDDIAKGDIVGVNSNGKLTNIFADSVSFVIKSTDPSYVGGDTWFNVEPPVEKDFKSKNEFEIAYEEFKVKREEARAKVDRIAFSGQIPCNVLGANVGDYIIPINDNGKIKGQAISNPTFEQYQNSIAKVWKIMEDGRAWVAVKIG